MGPIPEWGMGVLAGVRLRLGIVLPVGLDAVSLRILGVHPDVRMGLAARRCLDGMEHDSGGRKCAADFLWAADTRAAGAEDHSREPGPNADAVGEVAQPTPDSE